MFPTDPGTRMCRPVATLARSQTTRRLVILALCAGGLVACDEGTGVSEFDVGTLDAQPDTGTATSPDTATTDDDATTTDDATDDATQPFDDTQDAAGDTSGLDIPEGSGPPYPIVLAHGMVGFEHLANIEFVEYWFDVPEHLQNTLGEVVHVPEVDPLNSSEVRGAQLRAHVERIVEETGAARVILVGHSQGGLDARWVAHHIPERVAAVVTIASPHRGAPVSDVVLGVVQDDRVQDLADALVNFFGQPFYDELGNESSLFAPIRLFSPDGIAAFNAAIIDHPGVAYYSVAGRSGEAESDVHCYVEDSPEFIDRYWEQVDEVDPLLWLSESVSSSLVEGPNDGLVPVTSAKWGTFLGCVPADHMDEVGHLLGDDPGDSNPFDHLDFFEGLVVFLRAEGL